ncbi:MAG: Rieske 2Fe-2S domain-containing protein [Acidobacteriota bacterium]
MSVGYQAVQWNRQKAVYDRLLALGCLIFLGGFFGVTFALHPGITIETALLRAFALLAFTLLHVVLSIGPLARLDSRFLPLLYNRRHLGVTMFLAALLHAALATIQFHVGGPLDPLTSILAGNPRYDALAQFPFQPLGLAALVILFLMAATSHDFWLANLTAPVWKALHMGVYVAYALVVLHVALGALQSERDPLLIGALALGMAWILGLHLAAGWRERRRVQSAELSPHDEGFVPVCRVAEITPSRAKMIEVSGERVAVFRYDGKLSAISNVCQHQNGPLGEGKIVDGCVVCPWHGFQYRPEDGCAPEPFNEKLPTFRLRLEGDEIWVHPTPLAAGTAVPPIVLPKEIDHGS